MFLCHRCDLKEKNAIVVDQSLVKYLIDPKGHFAVEILWSCLGKACPVKDSVQITIVIVVSSYNHPISLFIRADVIHYLPVLNWVFFNQEIRIGAKDILLEIEMVCRVDVHQRTWLQETQLVFLNLRIKRDGLNQTVLEGIILERDYQDWYAILSNYVETVLRRLISLMHW